MKLFICALALVLSQTSLANETKIQLPKKRIVSSSESAAIPFKSVETAKVQKQLIKKSDFKAITPQFGFVFSNPYGGDTSRSASNSKFEIEGATGLSVGTHFDLDLIKSKTAVIETGIFYRQLKGDITGRSPGGANDGEVDLRYLNVPVSLKVQNSISNTTAFFGRAGGAVNLLLSDSFEYSIGNQSVDTSSIGFSKFDLGLNAGAGLKLKPQGPANYEYIVDVNYYLGVLKVIDEGNNDDIYNSALSLNLGVSYNL